MFETISIINKILFVPIGGIDVLPLDQSEGDANGNREGGGTPKVTSTSEKRVEKKVKLLIHKCLVYAYEMKT